ncbi:lysozyme inhibitor LprI family protein [Xenorhabdus eapokensis]|uniref:Lysozyme inhibitor LprI-like N-terminal domain-containing protein n=1 Tax=Xenorhabdus eapokensis TaxID=1873482 RepID=A0A1Q5TSW3_9GAMM|nr:lysozyme inhibitor LprI family protein [Xenorhabdus eapokensis]OKP03316.1 hypothetical protein Xedl_01913 [Xenorhabdus eapokensis]
MGKKLLSVITLVTICLTNFVSYAQTDSKPKGAYTECFENPEVKSTIDMAPCLAKLQHSANQELAKVFRNATKHIADTGSSASDAAIKSYHAALKAFETFRNIECQRVGDTYMGGNGAGAGQASCAVDLTRWYTEKISLEK